VLDRFYVSEQDQIRTSDHDLRKKVTEIFERVGVPPEDAAIGADTLVQTDLRGVEAHGVSNMLRQYVDLFRSGKLNPTPEWKILREFPGTATIDGDGGLGVIQGPRAMQMAIEKARTVGIGVVTMHNSGHLGAVGHHAMLAAQQDMVGMCMTAGHLRAAPTFGREMRIGTNPISFAAPARREPFVLFDAAMTSVARNKITLAKRLGAQLEPGWVADANGKPIMEYVTVPDNDTFQLLLLGATREGGSHKAYGLALMVEVLATLLSGSTPYMVDNTTLPKHYFAAYNIAAFTDVDEFKDTADQMLRVLQDTPPAEGHERVLYPGLLEYEHELERREAGIPLHREVVDWFDSITTELGLPQLERRQR
jgi:L-2-hydroxycarboxylate dehydrogenase (NAD+)